MDVGIDDDGGVGGIEDDGRIGGHVEGSDSIIGADDDFGERVDNLTST